MLVSKSTTFSQKSTGAGILDRAIAKLFGLLTVIKSYPNYQYLRSYGVIAA
nr:hypothetical protein [Nostoc sp. ChiSLP03a]MDZ8216326.1 hypothetical protein [Nostoc sp. ChiSLP03a]